MPLKAPRPQLRSKKEVNVNLPEARHQVLIKVEARQLTQRVVHLFQRWRLYQQNTIEAVPMSVRGSVGHGRKERVGLDPVRRQ